MGTGPSTSRGRAKHVVGVLVVPDAVVLELAITREVFGPLVWPAAEGLGAAADSPYEVVFFGEQRTCVLDGAMTVGDLAPLDALADVDTVVVPGIGSPLAERSGDVLCALRGARDSGARLLGFCGGAFVLAQAGLLDGRRATTHWMLADQFRRRHPRVRLEIDRLYVDDPPVHTSGGIFAATDLALHIVALDRGQSVANDLGRVLVSAPHRPGGQAQFVKESLRVHDATGVDSLLAWLRENIAEPLTLADLAAREHMSERSLVRKFRAATGMSVFEWIHRERVDRAKALLETTDFAVAQVAIMAGFGSTESLRRHFERFVGTTAGAYRRTFRGARPA